MSNRALRGSGLGGVSFEDERGVEFAPRQTVCYECTNAHTTEVTMAHDAEVPTLWECPRCGREARITSGEHTEVKPDKPPRTHWDMLRERRSLPELEQLLEERLALLRAGEIGPAHLHRRGRRRSA